MIVYPTGGGTGLVGMWKAFDEMERLGWIGESRPRMVSVQAEGCAPIVRAWEAGERRRALAECAHVGGRSACAARDRRLPDARCDSRSRGTALAVSDDAIATRLVGWGADRHFRCARGAATLAALPRLLERGLIHRGEEVVLFNTGSGLKYVDVGT